ncbi:patatin-like phospholipase family protein [Massilia cavernae]|nr:patatin-like phospholipase family protein [Massilia cavernae]
MGHQGDSQARAGLEGYHTGTDQKKNSRPLTRLNPSQEIARNSTEEIYFDFLKTIGSGNLDLRVIVDVIAGSSAGGINGIVLARALAHDLRIEPITDMWINEADIARVLAAEAKAEFWNKWYVRPFIGPFIWGLAHKKNPLSSIPDQETKKKLSLFLRSRWFEPPLGGQLFSNILLDGLGAMGEPRTNTASLLPQVTSWIFW